MKPIEELDSADYPEVEFEELEDTAAENAEIELLMKCVGAARQCGA